MGYSPDTVPINDVSQRSLVIDQNVLIAELGMYHDKWFIHCIRIWYARLVDDIYLWIQLFFMENIDTHGIILFL